MLEKSIAAERIAPDPWGRDRPIVQAQLMNASTRRAMDCYH